MSYRQDLPGISCDGAARLVRAAVDQAGALGLRINAAVVDRGGNTIAFLRMPGAFLHSADLAVDKAYTAASFGFPTGQWMSVICDNPRLLAGIPSRPRVVVLGGGFPVEEGGVRLGGIGVSGGSEAEDEACALAALEALGFSVPA
jgi:uncharacterized protein GlcG (DUF336 family)